MAIYFSRAYGLDLQPDLQQTTDDGATVLIAEVKHFSDSMHRLLRADFEAMGRWLKHRDEMSPASDTVGTKSLVFVSFDPQKCRTYLTALQRVIDGIRVLDGRRNRLALIRHLADRQTSRVLRAFRRFLISLAGKGMRVLRDRALANVTPSQVATDVLSCQRAEREAAIQPAFAPPSVVIRWSSL